MANPREIFPEEVWNLILNCVKDPQDIQSCSQTCTLFQNHLSSTRTNWAFPLIFPSLIKFLPRSDVLQCRLVSRDWVKGVDNFLQSNKFAPILVQQLRSHHDNIGSSFLTRIPNYQIERRRQVNHNDDALVPGIQVPRELVPAGPNNVANLIAQQELHHVQLINQLRDLLARGNRNAQNFALRVPIPLLPELPNPHQIEFLNRFENNSEKNPFPSRALILDITNTTIESTNLLLKKFGRCIWSLKLSLRLSAMSGFQVLQLIWNILKRVPNLKHLLVDAQYTHFSLPLLTDSANFESFLNTTVTPVLQQLKWIELDIKSCQSVRDILIKAYQSRSVTIFERDGYIKPTHLAIPGWNHLGINLELNRKSAQKEWKGHIRSFKQLNLPLESIDLHYFKCEDFESIFDSLSKYGSTLRRLKLTLTDLQIGELVKMRNQVNAIYVSFLSQMKCLENFNMILDCAGCERTIEFRQFVDGVLDADWIDNYLEMGGVISGFRRFGYACISAGLKMKADGSSKLKRKYFTDGKYFRSMEVVPSKNN